MYLIHVNHQDPKIRRALKLFPGRDGNTDIRMAIAEAVNQLQEERSRNQGMPSQDMIVLITDGRSNCSSCGYALSQIQDLDMDNTGTIDLSDFTQIYGCSYLAGCNPTSPGPGCPRCFNQDDVNRASELWASGCNFGCKNNYDHFLGSVNDTRSLVSGMFAANTQIPVHTIAIGREVAPHVLDVQDPSVGSRRCLTDTQARSLRPPIPLVRGGVGAATDCENSNYQTCVDGYNRASSAQPFYEAVARLYEVSRMTGGIFAPVFLDQALHCAGGAVDCRATPNDPQCCQPGNVWTADKYCRTPDVQIRDYVQQIISEQSPFLVVDSN